MPVSKLSHSRDFTGENFYIVDVHKKSGSVTVRTSNLEVGHFSQAPDPKPKALYSHLSRKFPSGIYYSAYEAGFNGTSTHTALCKLGIQNIIVHAVDIPNKDKEKKWNEVFDVLSFVIVFKFFCDSLFKIFIVHYIKGMCGLENF